MSNKKEVYKRYREKNREKVRNWNKNWINNNRDRYNASKWILLDKNKRHILGHYSNGDIKCSVCGIKDIDVLTLDHINDDGADHRRSLTGSKRGGISFYRQLVKSELPDNLQVLCFNCNWKKEMLRRFKDRERNEYYARYNNSLQLESIPAPVKSFTKSRKV